MMVMLLLLVPTLLTLFFMHIIAGVVLFLHVDILEANKQKLGIKAGFIWMPLNVFRLVFFWPVIFGDVADTRKEKQKLLAEKLLVDGNEKGSDAQ